MNRNPARPMSARTARATPTPIPACAPVLRPDDAAAVLLAVSVAVVGPPMELDEVDDVGAAVAYVGTPDEGIDWTRRRADGAGALNCSFDGFAQSGMNPPSR